MVRSTDLASSQITFSRPVSTNNLVMTRVGVSTDKVTVTNWFSATANRLDFVNFTNGQVTAAQIDTLITGGGGSFSLGAPPPAMLALGDALPAASAPRPAAPSVSRDFLGGWNRNTMDLGVFDTGSPMTLGEQDVRGGRQVWRPIKDFVNDRAEIGIDRLIGAMATFGVEAVADANLPAGLGLDRSDLNQLAAHHEWDRSNHALRGEYRAQLE